ncbi:MAG: hypothetical protein WEB07_03430, partial [Natronospirillum sp.]
MKTKLLITVFLLAFTVSLVMATPVRVMMQHLEGPLGLTHLPVTPQNLSGNLFNGSADLPWEGNVYTLTWQFASPQLLTGHLSYDFELTSAHVALTGLLGYRPGSYVLRDVSGYTDLTPLQPYLQPYNNTVVGGQLWWQGVSMRWLPDPSHLWADGMVDLHTGSAQFSWLDGNRHSVDLPVLQGVFDTDEAGRVTAEVRDGSSNQPILQA